MARGPEPAGDPRLSALRSLRDLLLAERDALVARDREAILDCAARKTRLAGEVDAMLASAADLEGLADEDRTALAALSRECARLNRANGVTVAALRGVVDRALGILHGAPAEETAVYGPAGARRADATFGRYAGSA